MRYLTIRNIPADLGERLLEQKRARGRSLNQTVIDLLSQAVGLAGARRQNGLGELAGTWGADELATFEQAVADHDRIDEEHWR